jgi:RNA polymerase sigma-70 factor (ECF subfamily)
MNNCIRKVIYALQPIYRAVIVLSELEGFYNEEIARILGLSQEAVKIRLHRARVKLKEELSRYCILYRDDKNEFACDLKGEFKIIGESVIKRK